MYQHEILTNISSLQATAQIATIIMPCIAIVAAIYAGVQYHYGRRKSKISQSCDLAKYYADHIVWRVGLLSSGLININHVDAIKSKNAIRLTEKEAKDLISNHKITPSKKTALLSIDVNIAFQHCMQNPRFAEALNLPDQVAVTVEEGTDKKVAERTLNSVVAKMLAQKTEYFLLMLLNDLEWFSMNFERGIADEKAVYQSLHKGFLSTIQELYFFISFKNDSGPADKYFTNIMGLYNKWKAREDKKKLKAEKKYKKHEDAGVTRGTKV